MARTVHSKIQFAESKEAATEQALAMVDYESYGLGVLVSVVEVYYNSRTPRLYTAAAVAAELGISQRRVYQIAEERGLGQRLGANAMVFTEAELDNMRVRRTGRPPKR